MHNACSEIVIYGYLCKIFIIYEKLSLANHKLWPTRQRHQQCSYHRHRQATMQRELLCVRRTTSQSSCAMWKCDHAMEQQQQQEQEEMVAYWNNAILGLSMKIDATFQRIMFTKRLYPFCAMDETMFVQFLSLLLSFSFPVLFSFEYCLFSIWASFLRCELLHWLCGERLHSIK